MKNRDRALRLLAVGVVFIAVIVEAAYAEGIVRGVIPYAADVSPVLAPASVPVGDPSKCIEPAIWLRRYKHIVGGQGIRENTLASFDGLSRHQQNRRRAGIDIEIGPRRERRAKKLHSVLAHYVDGNAPTPIPVEESARRGGADSDLDWRIYVIHADPRAFFSLERISGNISLPFSLLRESVSGIGLRECPVGLVLGLYREFVSVIAAVLNFTEGIFCSLSIPTSNGNLSPIEGNRLLVLGEGPLHDSRLFPVDKGLDKRRDNDSNGETHSRNFRPIDVRSVGSLVPEYAFSPETAPEPNEDRLFWVSVGSILTALGICIIRQSIDAIRDAVGVGICVALMGIFMLACGIVLIGHSFS